MPSEAAKHRKNNSCASSLVHPSPFAFALYLQCWSLPFRTLFYNENIPIHHVALNVHLRGCHFCVHDGCLCCPSGLSSGTIFGPSLHVTKKGH